MNLVLLPGASKHNEEWLRQVELTLADQFDHSYRHGYAHWEIDQADIDLDLELDRLASATQDLSPYVVFAKSAGTILTSKATANGTLRPKAGLFVGFPMVMVRDHGLPVEDWLKTTDYPITVLQHTADPFGSYSDVQDFMSSTGLGNIAVRELPGDTHDYTEFEIIKEMAGKVLN